MSFRFFAVWFCLERQRGCGKIGLLLRPLFPPLNAKCPVRAWWALRGHVAPGRGGRVETNQTKSLHVSLRVEIMRRDFVVQILIFSMPRCLGSENRSSVSTGFCVVVQSGPQRMGGTPSCATTMVPLWIHLVSKGSYGSSHFLGPTNLS